MSANTVTRSLVQGLPHEGPIRHCSCEWEGPPGSAQLEEGAEVKDKGELCVGLVLLDEPNCRVVVKGIEDDGTVHVNTTMAYCPVSEKVTIEIVKAPKS